MTPLDKVFMLDIEARFDTELMKEIYEQGYSRIPVYDGNRHTITGILVTKDLMFMDTSRVHKLWQLKSLFMREVVYVNSDEDLQSILSVFKTGTAHFAVVREPDVVDKSYDQSPD